MASYASTAAQYAVLGGITTGALIYYKPHILKDLMAKLSPSQIPVPAQVEVASKKSNKKTKQDGNSKASGSETATAKSKKRKISPPLNETVTVTTTDGKKRESPRDDNDDMDAREFAEQLAKAQAGTKLQVQSKQSNSTTTTIRKSAILQSEPRSEADDEGSSVDERSAVSPSGRDISDMLEAPAPAAKSLRITNVPEQKKKEQTPKKFEEVLTKKQRQRQARREEEKRLVAEADKIHDQKKQQQLKQARTAAGTSNQIKANNFAASTKNAWENPVKTSQPNGTQPAPLLDTFETHSTTHEAVQTKDISPITGSKNNNASTLKGKLGSTATAAMAASERENGIAAAEEDATWEAVQSKKSKKKTRQDGDSSSDRSRSVSDTASTRSVSKVNGHANGSSKPAPLLNRYASIQPGTQTMTSRLANDEWAA